MSSSNPTANDNGATRQLDVLIIGAGFSGIYGLHKLRPSGLRVHVFEAGSYLGGVWHWNTYPGARIDSEMPFYQFSMPEVWRKWNWSERFPSGEELKRYFEHVDHTLDLSKDITYNANVIDARYDESTGKWTITAENGSKAACKYLICATGSSFKPHFPDFKNLHSFKGDLVHSTRWPKDANIRDKRVAVIGSGATAIQCSQEIAKVASHMTVYMRTVSISLPMFQRPMDEFEQRVYKSTYKSMFTRCRNTASGLGYDTRPGSVFELSDEEREELWEELWNRGGFNFNQANYRDFLVDPKANKLMYDFWAKKTRPRIKNPAKAALLVPEKPPFLFGTKRSSLEQDYYECLDQDNVDIVDVKANPIQEFTEKGIVCQDGIERQFDMIVLATGFDAMTGSLMNMNIHGRDGLTFRERWQDGVFTHLGLSPTAFTNGPAFIDAQVDIVVDLLRTLEERGVKSIEAKPEAERKWKQAIQDANDKTLLPLTDSWYMGANIPGKPREQLNYIGGIVQYEQECRAALANMDGFTVIKL
ncbi:hypothetical protein N0V84_004991 [Fusarium piperis]|uniref:FAD/NAD(P)-binding domain-containing protein n=1 Tax=Fusarium piperis TaxID=1435070 RepID=A0A9W8WEM0_9HYPO|nr:hypothetical protein N0V84_004991 [Fusarium piperis]